MNTQGSHTFGNLGEKVGNFILGFLGLDKFGNFWGGGQGHDFVTDLFLSFYIFRHFLILNLMKI